MRKRLVILGFVAMSLVAGSALAGWKVTRTITIYKNSSGQSVAVQGAFGTVHNTADATQFIQCIFDPVYGSSNYIECDARDINGTWGSCFSSPAPAALVTAFSTITPNSFVEFDINPTTGACTNLFVYMGSMDQTATTN
jgi:hypothetical protein